MLRFIISKNRLWLIGSLAFCFFFACNNSSENAIPMDDSTATAVDTLTITDTTTASPVDTTAFPGTIDTAMVVLPDTAAVSRKHRRIRPFPGARRPPIIAREIDTAKKSATLGLSFYDQMRLHEIKPLTVYVSVKNGHARLRQEIRTKERQQNINRQPDDTSVVYTFDINIYERLTVTLHYDSSDFEITPLSKSSQPIDSTGTTRWTWNVKAISTKERSSTITVVLDPEPPLAGMDDLGPVNFEVKIRFSFWDMVRSWVVWLGENPQVTIPTILVPSVAWLFNRRRKQKASAGKTGEA